MTIQTTALGPNSFKVDYAPNADSKGALLLEMHSKITANGWETWDKRSVLDSEEVHAGEFNHFAVLAEDGSILSWGQDDFNQVTDSPADLDYTQVDSGGYHSVAIRSDGSLFSWGNDSDLQVTNTPSGTDFVEVSAGAYHTLARKADGSVVGWGNDVDGQVSNIPVETGFTQVVSGGYHCAALRADGSIAVWGQDAYGQVSNAPTGTGFLYLAAGPFFTLAIAADGSIVGWGRDVSSVLTDIPAGTGYIHVAAGMRHALAIGSDGAIVGWGDDSSSQLTGIPTGTNFITVDAGRDLSLAKNSLDEAFSWGSLLETIEEKPEFIQHFTEETTAEETVRAEVSVLDSTRNSTLALMDDSTVKVWGDDEYGKVSGAPTDSGYVAVFSGVHHHYAMKDASTIVGWGSDTYGQISNSPSRTDFKKLSLGGSHTLALLEDGSIIGWGFDGDGRSSGAPAASYIALAAGFSHSVAVKADGTLASWGSASNIAVANTPTDSGYKAVTAGKNFSVGLKDDGSIVVWGDDSYNQITDAPTETGFVAVDANEYNIIALASDGSVVVWGDDSAGQVTDAPTDTDFAQVAIGLKHGVAVRMDGTSSVWGDDTEGQKTDAPASGFASTETSTTVVPAEFLYSESVLPVGSGYEAVYRALNDDEVSYKYVHFIVQSNNLYVKVYEDWDNESHSGTNLAYRSDASGYSQQIRPSNYGSDTVYLFVHPRWLVVASTMQSSTDSSFCGCIEIEQALEDEVPGEYPIFAWLHGSLMYGSSMVESNSVNDQPVYAFSLPRNLQNETGELASKYMMAGTIANRSMTLHRYDSAYCSYYSTGNRSTNALRWDYRLADHLPDGTNPNKGNTNFVFTPYASCIDPEFAHIRGRFHGMKLIGNNVGNFGDFIEIPVDEFGFYSPNSQTLQNHFVFTNTLGGRIVLPL